MITHGPTFDVVSFPQVAWVVGRRARPIFYV
jgi:hypothetical protein